MIILVCFLLKIEKTNIYQLSGLLVSISGILVIITRLDLNTLLTLDFNRGDLFMLGGVIAWGIYSAFLKKRTFKVSLLAQVQIFCSLGLLILFPAFLYELMQGKTLVANYNLFYILLYACYIS